MTEVVGTKVLKDYTLEELEGLVEEHGSKAAAGRSMGVAPSTFKDRLRDLKKEQDGTPAKSEAEPEVHPFVSPLVEVSKAIRMQPDFPPDMTIKDFGDLLGAIRRVHKKTAFLWGVAYEEAVRRFGEEAYQLIEGWDYEEGTLKNYSRLTHQIHPELWEEPIADRHFFAIGQNVTNPDEQRKWVDYVKENRPSADELRKQIHQSQHKTVERSNPPAQHTPSPRICASCGAAEPNWMRQPGEIEE